MVKSFVTQTSDKNMPTILERLEYFSDWHHAKRAMATCLKFQHRLKNRRSGTQNQEKATVQPYKQADIEELHRAEATIIKKVQEKVFSKEIEILRSLQCNPTKRDGVRKRKFSMKKISSLYRLVPFLDDKRLLRVGGRLNRADVSYHIKHPVILPRKEHVTALVIRQYHQRLNHQGRGMTLNELRANGYWMTGGSSAVARHITSCVFCRKLRGAVQEQKMADLPKVRLEPAPPFTFCGVDYFGPWRIKEGRKEHKRYGVVFTCLASRAVHLQTAQTLETDSFINALRRFLARRGPVRQLRSDQGTNLVGAHRELKEALNEMNHDKVRGFLLERECDWFEFQMNVPTASHMGGVWKRQIKTVRNVLNALLDQAGTQLNEESLRTFMCEAEAIVNSRPLTVDNLT